MTQMGDSTNILQNVIQNARKDRTKAKKLQMVAEHQTNPQIGSTRISQNKALKDFGKARKKEALFFSLSSSMK